MPDPWPDQYLDMFPIQCRVLYNEAMALTISVKEHFDPVDVLATADVFDHDFHGVVAPVDRHILGAQHIEESREHFTPQSIAI